ncbi:MAG: cyanophycinase [Bacteroidota bacterium]|nr:cyanophycinase [Bacteroidota bacterium]
MAKKNSGQNESSHGIPVPNGKLLAIGGKEDKGITGEQNQRQENHNLEILGRFVEELKGDNPTVAIVPTASSVPDEIAKDYVEVFKKLNVKNIEILDIRSRMDAKDPAFCEIVNRASGIFITGGDQLKLTAILGGTRILQLMKERYTFDNIIVAGTSAGAAAMSTPMIYEGDTDGGMIKGDVRITTGLEFMKNVAVDTHFITRGRIVRMAQAIATNPGCIGIGLEEDTAIMVTEGRNIEVLGNGLITVVNGMDITYTNIYEIGNGEPFTVQDLKVHFLNKGECFRLTFYEQLHI